MRSRYWPIYLAVLLLSFHYAFTLYINSTYLSSFFGGRTIDELYALGSIGTIFGLVVSSSLIRRFGNFFCLIFALIAEAAILFGLAHSTSRDFIALFFLFHQMLPPLMLYSLDVFLEGEIPTEKITGRIRSTYLAISNTALVLSPIFVGFIIGPGNYRSVYIFSASFVILALLVVASSFNRTPIKSPREINFADSMRKFPHHEGLATVFGIDFLLQCFYAVMVIYTPLYLHQVVGFPWPAIGVMFTLMLIPFPIIEPILGRMFDKTHGERETTIAGFVIIGLSCLGMFFSPGSFIAWTTLLFLSRIGASCVEIGGEYSFFKRVNDRDAGFISVFRTSVPLSYIIAPSLFGILSMPLGIGTVFCALATLMILGIPLAFQLKIPKNKVAGEHPVTAQS